MISLAVFDAFCQGLPGANFVVQWGDSHVHKVGPRLFAIGNLPGAGFVFKATPVGFAILMEQGLAVRAPYLRRGHWVAVAPNALKQAELFAYVRESHRLAVAALTRAQRRELGLAVEQG
jgi:predicted DNA-binding protein (MmcQ/YjbR family)